jgi:hypothetical protein
VVKRLSRLSSEALPLSNGQVSHYAVCVQEVALCVRDQRAPPYASECGREIISFRVNFSFTSKGRVCNTCIT